MIRLKSLITEISLGQPYQTQFTWRHESWGEAAVFDTPNTTIEVLAVKGNIEYTGNNNTWSIGFSTKTPQGWSVNQTSYWGTEAQRNTVDAAEYLRILSTVAEATFDFIAQRAPLTVTFEPYDSDAKKMRQKTAAYMSLLRSAETRLKTMGYRYAVSQGGEVMITRKSNADATGIVDSRN